MAFVWKYKIIHHQSRHRLILSREQFMMFTIDDYLTAVCNEVGFLCFLPYYGGGISIHKLLYLNFYP